MAILKVLSTDTVEQAFINKYNPTVDEIIVSISRTGNIFTFTKEGGGTLTGELLPEKDGCITGLILTNGATNLAFLVSAGTYNIADELYSYAGGGFTLSDGDATFDRVDLAVVNTAGNLVIKVGTPAASPVPPTISATETLVSSFLVKAGATTATSGDVFVNTTNTVPTEGPYIPSSQLGEIIENPTGVDTLGELNDVTLAGEAADDVLLYDGAEWINSPLSINQLSNVNIGILGSGQVLSYNFGASMFEPVDYKIPNLNDVDITGLTDGQILVWNNSTQKWENEDTNGAGEFTGKVIFNNIISPPQITANTNDYNPTGLGDCNIIRVSTDANYDLTGIVGQEDGRSIIIFNIGTNNLKLKVNSVLSAAGNRFLIKNDITIQDDEGVNLIYDAISNGWREINK